MESTIECRSERSTDVSESEISLLSAIYLTVRQIYMSVLPSRSTYYFRSELARNRSSPARLRGGWGLAGAGAGVP